MLRRILALPLAAGWALQPGETNLDNGGGVDEEVSEKAICALLTGCKNSLS
jgi:hypothetical protein